MLYFYVEAQGTETQRQTRNRLLDKWNDCIRCMINMQAMTHQAFSQPVLGQYACQAPEALFSRLVRGEVAEAISKAIIHAGTVFRCTGQMMPLYLTAIYFELPYSHIPYVVDHIINHATNNPQAKFHESIRCFFNFQDACWCDRLNILQTHRIESLMFEIVARWDSTLENIEQMAQANSQLAKWVVSAA